MFVLVSVRAERSQFRDLNFFVAGNLDSTASLDMISRQKIIVNVSAFCLLEYLPVLRYMTNGIILF